MKIIKNFYPSSILRGIDSIIQDCMSRESVSPFTPNAVNYLTSLFPGEPYSYYPQDAFLCIWNNLIRFQRRGMISWLKAYWEYAVSYSNYSLNSVTAPDKIIDNVESLRFKFQEFHHMFCAYLLYAGNYELINHLLNYSTSSFGANSLRPDNINDIVNHLRIFDQLLGEPFYAESYYSFHLNNGVKEGNTVVGWLECFYILRLIQIKDISIVNTNKCIQELKEDLRICEDLSRMLAQGGLWAQLRDSTNFTEVFNIDDRSLEYCINNLNGILDQIEQAIKTKQEAIKPNEDLKKNFIDKINNLISEELKRSNFPCEFVKSTSENLTELHLPKSQYPKEYFTDMPSISYINFPESYSSLSLDYISSLYERNFLLTSAVKTYLINYTELDQALSMLQLDSTFALISLGADISSIKNSPIEISNRYFLRSQLSEVVILKADACPILKICNPVVSIDIKDTSPSSDQVLAEGVIKYKYENSIIEQKKNSIVKYIRLRLIYQDYVGIKSSLLRIIPISNLIV